MNNIDDKEVGVKKREFIGRKLKFFDDDDSIAKTEDNKVLTDKQLNKTPWSDTKMKKCYGMSSFKTMMLDLILGRSGTMYMVRLLMKRGKRRFLLK